MFCCKEVNENRVIHPYILLEGLRCLRAMMQSSLHSLFSVVYSTVGFAQVIEVMHKSTKTMYACKVMRFPDSKQPDPEEMTRYAHHHSWNCTSDVIVRSSADVFNG